MLLVPIKADATASFRRVNFCVKSEWVSVNGNETNSAFLVKHCFVSITSHLIFSSQFINFI